MPVTYADIRLYNNTLNLTVDFGSNFTTSSSIEKSLLPSYFT